MENQLSAMKSKVEEIPVPAGSRLAGRLHNSYFMDAYKVRLPDGQTTAMEILLRIMARTPPWVNRLMALRNRIVALFGLKDVGLLEIKQHKPAAEYVIGDQVGIFTLQSIEDQEVIAGILDSHLDVSVSIYKISFDDHDEVAVSTVVWVHNLLGKAYMLLITPFHRIISRKMTSYAARAPVK